MSQTIKEKNKALVLKAFDTLFNKRDYRLSMFVSKSRATASASPFP